MILTKVRPTVSAKTITKVTRLFNGTLNDILNELLQNARRAGATEITIVYSSDDFGLDISLTDNGPGIASPQTFLSLGDSDWGDNITSTEDPAGMGVFSLAGKSARITSRNQSSRSAWSMDIPADGWTGEQDIDLEEADHPQGTTIRFFVENATVQAAERFISQACRHYPLPVTANGMLQQNEDFLKNALHIEEWNGSRIGIFSGPEYHSNATVNFHGLTLNRKIAAVSETTGGNHYHARIDIGATPGLNLVLPARKEFVENDTFAEMTLAARKAIYRAIGKAGPHRLSFDNWKCARDLGVKLPEAEPVLRSWTPETADRDVWNGDFEEFSAEGANVCVVSYLEPALATPLHRALLKTTESLKLADRQTAYEGYEWYDTLRTLKNVRFYVTSRDQGWIIAENGCFPPLEDHVKADSIELRCTIVHGPTETEKELRIPTDLALTLTEDVWTTDLDTIRIAYRPNDTLTPSVLTDILEASCFSSSEDSDADSWETQNNRFMRDARELATRILIGEDAALCTMLSDHIEKILWQLPITKDFAVLINNGVITVKSVKASAPNLEEQA